MARIDGDEGELVDKAAALPKKFCVQPLNQPLPGHMQRATCAVDTSGFFSFGPLRIMRRKRDWRRTLLPPI